VLDHLEARRSDSSRDRNPNDSGVVGEQHAQRHRGKDISRGEAERDIPLSGECSEPEISREAKPSETSPLWGECSEPEVSREAMPTARSKSVQREQVVAIRFGAAPRCWVDISRV
jgi:hypothetical protein